MTAVVCLAKLEVCNGTDDNCDGVVDDECVSPGTVVWVKEVDGASGSAITALTDGSLAVTGTFFGEVTFGADDRSAVTLTSATGADEDIFLARYDSVGVLKWAARAGGAESDYGMGVATGADNGVLVSGEFFGEASFGAGERRETTIVPIDGVEGMFVAMYDSAGTLDWARHADGPGTDVGASVAALADGSAVVTGAFQREIVFGQGEPHEVTLTATGTGSPLPATEAFVAKYTPLGTLAWAKPAGGAGFDEGSAVTALSDGGVVVAGAFEFEAVFGRGETGQVVLSGGLDMFVARFTPTGRVVWARRAGGTGTTHATGVAVLADGGVVVTGGFSRDASFGEGELRAVTLHSFGSEDVFVAKYDPSGMLAWAEQAGSAYTDTGNAVAVFADGSIALAGAFSGPAVFGGTRAREIKLETAGASDIFVARYDPSGAPVWATRAGGAGSDYARGVTVLADGTLAMTGIAAGPEATFGGGLVTVKVMEVGMLVAKYAP
jgi:hypothetical protein